MKIDDVVLVKGITQKGKTRVHEHGDFWKIVEKSNHVSCLNNHSGILLESVKTGWFRWTGVDDGVGDFDIIMVV